MEQEATKMRSTCNMPQKFHLLFEEADIKKNTMLTRNTSANANISQKHRTRTSHPSLFSPPRNYDLRSKSCRCVQPVSTDQFLRTKKEENHRHAQLKGNNSFNCNSFPNDNIRRKSRSQFLKSYTFTTEDTKKETVAKKITELFKTNMFNMNKKSKRNALSLTTNTLDQNLFDFGEGVEERKVLKVKKQKLKYSQMSMNTQERKITTASFSFPPPYNYASPKITLHREFNASRQRFLRSYPFTRKADQMTAGKEIKKWFRTSMEKAKSIKSKVSRHLCPCGQNLSKHFFL